MCVYVRAERSQPNGMEENSKSKIRTPMSERDDAIHPSQARYNISFDIIRMAPSSIRWSRLMIVVTSLPFAINWHEVISVNWIHFFIGHYCSRLSRIGITQNICHSCVLFFSTSSSSTFDIRRMEGNSSSSRGSSAGNCMWEITKEQRHVQTWIRVVRLLVRFRINLSSSAKYNARDK